MSAIVSDLCRVPVKWLAKVLNIPDDVANHILVDMCGYNNRNGVCIPRVLMPLMCMCMPLRQPRVNMLGHSIVVSLATHRFRKRMIEKYYMIAYMENKTTGEKLSSCGTFYMDEEDDYVIDKYMYRVDMKTDTLITYSPHSVYSEYGNHQDQRNFCIQSSSQHDDSEDDDEYDRYMDDLHYGSEFIVAYNNWREERGKRKR